MHNWLSTFVSFTYQTDIIQVNYLLSGAYISDKNRTKLKQYRSWTRHYSFKFWFGFSFFVLVLSHMWRRLKQNLVQLVCIIFVFTIRQTKHKNNTNLARSSDAAGTTRQKTVAVMLKTKINMKIKHKRSETSTENRYTREGRLTNFAERFNIEKKPKSADKRLFCMSCSFMSSNFMPWNFVRLFHVLQFHVQHFQRLLFQG